MSELSELREFWTNGWAYWPSDVAGEFTFLGRAVLRIGKAKYGDRWSDQDVWPTPRGVLPELQKAASEIALSWAHQLISKPFVVPEPQVTADLNVVMPRPVLLSHADWEEARSRSVEASVKANDAFQRFWSTIGYVHQKLLAGELSTYTRSQIGGPIEGPTDRWVWNHANFHYRFGYCLLDVASKVQKTYLSPSMQTEDFRYVFVSEPELIALIVRIRNGEWPTGHHNSEDARRRGPGRPKGSGAINDALLLDAMQELMQSDEAKSVHDAAQQVAQRAEGHSKDAITKRISRKYNKSARPRN